MRLGRAAAVMDTALAACLLAVGSYGVARHNLISGWPCVGFGFVFSGLAFIWVRSVRAGAASSEQPAEAVRARPTRAKPTKVGSEEAG